MFCQLLYLESDKWEAWVERAAILAHFKKSYFCQCHLCHDHSTGGPSQGLGRDQLKWGALSIKLHDLSGKSAFEWDQIMKGFESGGGAVLDAVCI